jgi:hypothetical protein
MGFQRIGGDNSHNVIGLPEVSTHVDASKFLSEWILLDFLGIDVFVPDMLLVKKVVLRVIVQDPAARPSRLQKRWPHDFSPQQNLR